MREDIIRVLKNSDKALNIYELQDKLAIDTVEETTIFSEELRKLVDDGYVEKIGKDPIVYRLTEQGKNINLEEGE